METQTGFRGLIVWQKPQDFAVESLRLIRELHLDRPGEAIGLQFVRAATSVAANIAEGFGRYSDGAYRNHLSVARGSLFEAESWLDLMVKSGYLSSESASPLLQQSYEIARILSSMMKSLGTRRSAIREDGADYTV
jgi:four helix bundle protein